MRVFLTLLLIFGLTGCASWRAYVACTYTINERKADLASEERALQRASTLAKNNPSQQAFMAVARQASEVARATAELDAARRQCGRTTD